MFHVGEQNEPSVARQANEIIEKVRSEFGDRNTSENDTPEIVASKCKRILELLGDNFASNPEDGNSCRLEVLWRTQTAFLAPFDALLQTNYDLAAHKDGAIFVKQYGIWQKTDLRFNHDVEFIRHVNRLLQPLGKSVDISHPDATAFMSDGSRIEAVLPPISSFPTVTITRPAERTNFWTLDELSDSPTESASIKKKTFSMLSEAIAATLSACVRGRVNVIISGGVSSGKTVLLQALSQKLEETVFKSDHFKLVAMIAPDGELVPPAIAQVLCLSPESPNSSRPGLNRKQLLEKSANMMAERVVMDKCTGSETYDLIRLMGSRLKGCMTTVEADTPRDCLINLESMIFEEHPHLPISIVRHFIAKANPLIVQTKRFEDGTRRISEIVEVRGINDGSWHSNRDIAMLNMQDLRENEFIINTLFYTSRVGRDPRGFFKMEFNPASKVPPRFIEQLNNEAVPFKLDWIQPKVEAIVK
jgi:pilus assembly protein CpaF